MKKIVYGVLAALMCSCASGGYTIKGGDLEDLIAGDSVAIVNIDAPEEPVATYVVEQDGVIDIKGSTEQEQIAAMLINDKFVGFLMLESGDIEVNSANNETSFTGTPLNDEMSKFYAETLIYQQKFEAAADSQTEIDDLQAEYTAFVSSTIDENLDNAFGAFLFARSEMNNLEASAAKARIAQFDAKLMEYGFMSKAAEQVDAMLLTEVGQPYTDLKFTDFEGKEVAVSDLLAQGKYVLIDFWATWCGPCMGELPHLREAYAEFKDKDFEIFGVSLDRSEESWKKQIAKGDMPWVNVFDNEEVNAAKAYAISVIPTNFLISPEGVIVAKNLRGEDIATILSEHIK